jgi:hypothetical protein
MKYIIIAALAGTAALLACANAQQGVVLEG